jgi:hypothetical protein
MPKYVKVIIDPDTGEEIEVEYWKSDDQAPDLPEPVILAMMRMMSGSADPIWPEEIDV